MHRDALFLAQPIGKVAHGQEEGRDLLDVVAGVVGLGAALAHKHLKSRGVVVPPGMLSVELIAKYEAEGFCGHGASTIAGRGMFAPAGKYGEATLCAGKLLTAVPIWMRLASFALL